MAERNRRKVLRGTVVSDKMDKTIVVEITTAKADPKYGRHVKFSTKFKAHDENNEAKVGDTVKIRMTRPLSKTKRYELVEVLTKAVIL